MLESLKEDDLYPVCSIEVGGQKQYVAFAPMEFECENLAGKFVLWALPLRCASALCVALATNVLGLHCRTGTLGTIYGCQGSQYDSVLTALDEEHIWSAGGGSCGPFLPSSHDLNW